MIQATFQAFYAHYSDSPLPAFVEGFFFGEVPEGTSGNYAVFTPLAMVPEYDMSSHLELIPIQIAIYTNTAEENEGPTVALNLGELFMTWFDNCTLSIGGATLVRIDRESHNLIQDPDGGWMYQIDYAILVQEAI